MTGLEVPLPDGAVLHGERHGDPQGATVVLLHAGVADRRVWSDVLRQLDRDGLDLVAYDRRGYGGSADASGGFTHLADLLALLDAVGADRATLVGNSMGGGLAIDLALAAPERVAALLLIGSAVSGMTDEGEEVDWAPDPATATLLSALERAEQAHDLDEQARLEAHLWLDGPTAPEGRVGGAARRLAVEMNRAVLARGTTGQEGASGIDAWHRLGEVAAPALAVWGSLDVPADEPFYRLAAERLAHGRGRVLDGVAHLPSLERPDLVADLVREVVTRAR